MFVLVVLALVGYKKLEPKIDGCAASFKDNNRRIYEEILYIRTAAEYAKDSYYLEGDRYNQCDFEQECSIHRSASGVTALSVIDHNNETMYFTYKGTSTKEEMAIDVSQATTGGDKKAKEYFTDAYLQLGNFIDANKIELNSKEYKLIVSGHSLGGALAMYSSNRARSDLFNNELYVYTFSSAVLHDSNQIVGFQSIPQLHEIEKVVNFVSVDDIVPRITGVRSYLSLQGYTYALENDHWFYNPYREHGIKSMIKSIYKISNESQLCNSFVRFRYLVSEQ